MHRSSAGEYEQTPITLFLLRCSAGGILWKKTRHNQIVTFFRSRKPFTLCLGVELPGANVSRLDGPSRHLIAASNVSGTVGCFESHCGHASFLFEADSKTKVRYAYSFTEDAQSEVSLSFTYAFVCVVAFFGFLSFWDRAMNWVFSSSSSYLSSVQ